MKKKANLLLYLSPVYLVLGMAAMVDYRWLFNYLEDDVSLLLPAGTVPEIFLWILTALAIVVALVCSRQVKMEPVGKLGALGDLVFAAGFAVLLTRPATGPVALVAAYRGLCIAATVSLLAGAALRFSGRTVPFLLTLFPCLACVTQLLVCYQLWSEVPQLMDYVMGLGAVLTLTLSSYVRVSAVAGLPAKKWHHAVQLLGIYFCAAATVMADFSIFFLCCTLYLGIECSGLRPEEA